MPTIQFFKYEPTHGRGHLGVVFREVPPDHVVRGLCNVLNSQGYEVESDGRVYKFYTTNSHVSDIKVDLAKQVIHREGLERFDEVWDGQDDADYLFGYDSQSELI